MLIEVHNINRLCDIVTRHPEIKLDASTVDPDGEWLPGKYHWNNKTHTGVVSVVDVTIICETFISIVKHDPEYQVVFGLPLAASNTRRKVTYVTSEGSLSKSQLSDDQKSIAKTLFDIWELRYCDDKTYMMPPKFLTLDYIAACRYLRRHEETPLDYLKATRPYVQRAVTPEDTEFARLLIQHHKALDPQPDPEDIRRHELIRRETLGLIDLKLIGDLTL